MTNRALAMPEYVAQLIILPLVRMGLDPSDAEDDVVTCPLLYEDGSTLSLAVMCIAQRRWFSEKPTLVVSVVRAEGDRRPAKVYFRETMTVPASANDLRFIARFSAKVRAMAWTVAAIGNMGECLSVPGRPK